MTENICLHRLNFPEMSVVVDQFSVHLKSQLTLGSSPRFPDLITFIPAPKYGPYSLLQGSSKLTEEFWYV